jgi:peptidyl-tRNA hydrolase, PTH1 family
MKTFIGLGNPGKEYELTRHNVGFLVLDELAIRLDTKFKSKRSVEALLAEGQMEDQRILLAKPQTFMNISGRSLLAIMNKYPVTIDDVTIIYDDADLAFGDVRIKEGGGAAGHRGMASILNSLPKGTKVNRIRIGIGRPSHTDIPLDQFVLQSFSKDEQDALPQIIDQVIEKIYAS